MDKKALLEAIFCECHGWDNLREGRLEVCPSEPSDDKLREAFSALRPQEVFVLEHRFADQHMTLKAVGKICPRAGANRGIGVSTERVRQIEARALRKLRHPSRRYILLPKGEVGV